MNYLITGNRGFIGTNLTSYLHSLGHSVTGLDYFDCDLCDGFPSVLRSSKIDIIVHLAAETDVRESIKLPVKYFFRNCKSTANMLELARTTKSKFIFASSYGAMYLTSPYAASKIACEALCESYRQSYNMSTVILRLPNVYGPWSDHKKSVIPTFIKARLKNEPVTIFGDGTQTRNFVYISDICKAIHEATDNLELTTGQLTSINEIAEMLRCKVNYSESIKGEVNRVSSIRNLIPEYSLDQGLDKTIMWFKEFYEIR